MYKDEQKHIRYIKSRYFDAEPNMYAVEEFMKVLNLKALVKQPACSKNVPTLTWFSTTNTKASLISNYRGKSIWFLQNDLGVAVSKVSN